MAEIRIAAASPAPPAPSVPRPVVREAGGEAFGAALGRALEEVNTLQLEAHAAATQLAAGRPVDMAAALVSVEKASISFQFALQVRNKLLEAYQEIMRMQV
jgi:flagellar hook-basal body complex protein FliE